MIILPQAAKIILKELDAIRADVGGLTSRSEEFCAQYWHDRVVNALSSIHARAVNFEANHKARQNGVQQPELAQGAQETFHEGVWLSDMVVKP